MKLFSLLLVLSSIHGMGQTTYKNIVRQTQQGTGVVWDMQSVAVKGTASSVLALESAGSLFQLWTINQTTVKDYLLDQKLVGAYLPKADIKITTPDSFQGIPWTRIDKPFSVEITVSDLRSGIGLPEAATKVLQERHIQTYPAGTPSLSPTAVTSTTPVSAGYITVNGKTTFTNLYSQLKPNAPGDATTASGEEHFVVHALPDGSITQTQIASAYLKVWPIASGKISGIKTGDVIRTSAPEVELILTDLYPRSDTYFVLYQGSGINAATGTVVKSYPMTALNAQSHTLKVTELNSSIKADGPHTLALMSDTVYGRELLCDPIYFNVDRSLEVNAMQVNFSGDAQN